MPSFDGKITASSFWSHIVCFMFMSIWFSTMCFTAFSVVSFHVHVVQHAVLKFILSTKMFKHVFQITYVNHAAIFLACSAKLHVHKNCAMEDSHGMCIAFWVTYMPCMLFCRSRRHHQRMMRHGQQSQMNANHVSISLSGSS